MIRRNISIACCILFTVILLVSCMNTDYTGKWKGNFNGTDMIYDLKMESYTIETMNANDSLQNGKYKGVILKDRDTLTFVPSMRFDNAQNLWVEEQGGKSDAVYQVIGDTLILRFDKALLRLGKVK